MRTVLLLTLVALAFASSFYVAIVRLRLTNAVGFPIVVIVTVGVAVLWVLWDSGLLRPSTEFEKRWAAQVEAHGYRQQEEKRIAADMMKRMKAEIRNNPALAPFLSQVESGEIRSIEDLTYRSNPSILVTCSHLRPIESKLRQAGCKMWLWHAWNYTTIPGTIFASALLQKFPAPLEYTEEEFYDERTPPYFSATLACPQCNSTIHCTHPNNTGPGTIRWKDL
ncbi:MAG: hypothetical protein U0R19_25605 [Bryobacteraceae bacterium]